MCIITINKFSNLCLKIPKGAIPVNYTSVTDWHDGIM